MDYLLPLIREFQLAANTEKAQQMQNYLKGLFAFYGISAPERNSIEKNFFKSHGLPHKQQLWDIVFELWQMTEREYQHIAITLILKFEKELEQEDIYQIEKLIITKSWWDTVDALSPWICGAYFKKFPDQIKPVTGAWVISNNIWLQRSALLFQLKYKKLTDTKLLSGYIKKLSGSNEFFVRKAIGWILREYSKVDPEWVRKFISQNNLSGLSYREASKYI